MPIEIPVDVLRDILDYVDKADLPNMCLLNKICCSCSQNVLYRNICVKTPKVQQTLAQSAHLARRVCSFDSSYEDADLAMALRNMTSLRTLKLLGEFHVDILDGCTFKLDSFECTYLDNCSEFFQNFLSSQPSMKSVTLPLDFDYTVSSPLEATCLPNLTRINAAFPWFPHLIPGRPLKEVIMVGSTSHGHSIDWSFFTLSTTPIQKLTVDYSQLYPTPGHLLASFLPSLTHFTLTVWRYYTFFEYEGFGLEIDHWIENMLVAFDLLQVFTLQLWGNRLHPSEKYLQYITKASDQAPHLEFFAIQDGDDYTFRCKRVNENWAVCDEAEYT